MSTPLYRPTQYDADDVETGFDPKTGGTKQSAECARRDRVIKAAVRIRLFAKTERRAIKQMREYIAGLSLPMHRLVRLNDLACSERWPTEAWGPPKPACAPMPGNGCTYGQWREAAFLVHRAALSLLLDAQPASYSDVHDQIRMLFYATPISLEDGQRRKLSRRMAEHVGRLVAGLPFHPLH